MAISELYGEVIMDLISGLQVFIRVVETGSFSAVARETNVSQSAVTRQIAQLEDHFDARLLHRTTRKLSLTDDGQELLNRARHLLEEAEHLKETFSRHRGEPSGMVRVGLPVGAGVLLVNEFTGLLKRYPGLSIDLVISEQIEDLVADRLDLALRFGQSSDTSLVSRAIATLGSSAVAAPAYLEQHGAPKNPADLINHACIIHDTGPDSSHWAFQGPKGVEDIEITSALRCDSSLVVRQAALGGYGIAMLGDALTVNDVGSSRLYRLLPDYTIRRREVFLVYPSRRHLAQRTRVVINFLVEQFRIVERRLNEGRAWGENEATWLV
jgi:DNA-binding transcriptional LysR family regulator